MMVDGSGVRFFLGVFTLAVEGCVAASGLHHTGQHLLKARLVLVVVVTVHPAAPLCESTGLVLVVALLHEFTVGKVGTLLCGMVEGAALAFFAAWKESTTHLIFILGDLLDFLFLSGLFFGRFCLGFLLFWFRCVLLGFLVLPGALFACILFMPAAAAVILPHFLFGIVLRRLFIRRVRSVPFEGAFLNGHLQVITLAAFFFSLSYCALQEWSYDFYFVFSKDGVSEVLIDIMDVEGKALLMDLLEVGFEIRRQHHLEGMVLEHVYEDCCLLHLSQSDASLGEGSFLMENDATPIYKHTQRWIGVGCWRVWSEWVDIIYWDIMIDRVLNFGPVQQQSYYFQLIPISLAIVSSSSQLPAAGTTYKFTVSKAHQKFDENKIPIEANFQLVGGRHVLAITTCRLNFYLPNYIKARKQEFSLVAVQRENNQDYELGDYKLSVDELVGQLKESNRVRHEYKVPFSDDYELEFEVYVEKSRMALERVIRDNKVERINKSPLRARREDSQPSPKKSFSPRQEEQLTPSRDNERPSTAVEPQEQTTQAHQAHQAQLETPIKPVETEPLEEKPQEKQEEPKQPKEQSERRQRSEKAEKADAQSRKTGQGVPVMTTKFKQVARADTPAEVNIEKSLRLLSADAPVAKPSSEGDLKEKFGIWLFLAVGLFVTYLSMHPNSKV